MNCNEAQALMVDYLYGELTGRKRKGLEKHLRACGQCSEEFTVHKTTISTFAKVQPEEPPAGISRTIAALAAEDLELKRPSRMAVFWGWKPVLATAAAAMLVMVCIGYYLPRASKYDVSGRMNVTRRSEPAPSQEWVRAKESPRVEAEEPLVQRYEAAKAAPDSSAYYAEEKDLGVYAHSTSEMADSVTGAVMEYRVPGDEFGVGGARARTRAKSQEPVGIGHENLMLSIEGRALDADAALPSELPPAAPTALMGEKGDASSLRALSETTVRQDVPADDKEEAKSSLLKQPSEFEQWKNERAQQALNEGNAYFEDSDFRGAVTSYQKVLTLKPGEGMTAQARYQIGRSYQESGSFEKAIASFEEILEQHPDFPQIAHVHIAIGECNLALGRMDDALRNFEIVRDRFPDLRETALEKIDALSAQQTTVEQSSESSPPETD